MGKQKQYLLKVNGKRKVRTEIKETGRKNYKEWIKWRVGSLKTLTRLTILSQISQEKQRKDQINTIRDEKENIAKPLRKFRESKRSNLNTKI